MNKLAVSWAPAVILGVGALFTVGIDSQQPQPLRADLAATMPASIGGFTAEDMTVPEAELKVAGVTDYLFRAYHPSDRGDQGVAADSGSAAVPFTLYVGYYEEQERGRTIHSPKNCLPGAGWEALTSTTQVVDLEDGRSVTVNRYLIQRDDESALVLYWYQGRGHIEANEYRVKLNLLLDTAFRQRSDEALVRLVVPVTNSVEGAADLATQAAASVIPALNEALPA